MPKSIEVVATDAAKNIKAEVKIRHVQRAFPKIKLAMLLFRMAIMPLLRLANWLGGLGGVEVKK